MMNLRRITGCILSSASVVIVSQLAFAQVPPPPTVAKGTDVDDFFGTKVADPYRALEDESRPETQAFIEAQNRRTHDYLNSPQRDQIKARITELIDYPRQSAPARHGKWAFFSTNTGLQNQAVLRVTDDIPKGYNRDGRVLIDPNKLAADGTTSLGLTAETLDGSLLAYGLAQSGSDHSEIHIKNVSTGEDLPDVLPPARQGSVGWLHDNSGFYYSKYPKTAEHGKAEQAYGQQVFFHKLGTPPADDKLIYERPEDKELGMGVGQTEDGKYEVMYLSRGTKAEHRLYWRFAGSNSDWNKLIDDEKFQYSLVGNDNSTFYFMTTDGAPHNRLLAIDVEHSERDKWKELISESKDVLVGLDLIDEKFIATYLHDAQSVIKIFDKNGSPDRDVELPTVGSANVVGGQRENTDFYYTFTSFSYPPTTFRYDLKTSKSEKIFSPTVQFDPAAYETKQTFADSKDGTKVPLFITYRKGLKLDGTHPALLTGYGGFNISTTPGFSATRVAWLEKGGVIASACMRGGGEYGEAWHHDGMFEKKQNVFDDFAAAAEKLEADGYTSSRKLAIQGGSNGGLLMGVVMEQHPELYGAVVCQVGVLDMLRYNKLGIGRFWTVEYGDASASTEQFKYLYAYSPLHNVKPNVDYPPLLITTGAGDNRVVPGHSYKFAATMQAVSTSPNPVLLRIESKAGHGGGKPTSKVIDEQADIYEFLFKTFGM